MITYNKSLCDGCEYSAWCNVWAEVKCLAKEIRIGPDSVVNSCDEYKKCGKDFKRRPCRCEDCLSSGANEEIE